MFQDVARGIYPSVTGAAVIPSKVTIDKDYEHTQLITIPAKVVRKRNLSVVAMVVDNVANVIANAVKIGNFKLSPDIEAGIGSTGVDGNASIYVSGEQLMFGQDVKSVLIMNVSGQIVKQAVINASSMNVSDLEKGIYVIKTVSQEGIVSIAKIYISGK